MSAPKKPTIVIVPGSWQLPLVWDEFRALLARAQYQSYHVDLPSVGGTTLPLTGLAEDVAAVQSVVQGFADCGDEIILLCHSSGGVVGSNAVEGYDIATRKAAGKKGGVTRVVYLSAFMLPAGQSLLGMLGGVPLPWMVVSVSPLSSRESPEYTSSHPDRVRVISQVSSLLLTLTTGRPRHRRPRPDARGGLQRPARR